MVPSVLASSICWSLQCLISALIQGGGGGHFFRLPFQSCLGCCKPISLARVRSVSATLGLRPLTECVLSLSTLRRLCQELSEAGPGLHAPPRSKLLRLRHSGSLQRRRLVGPAFCALPMSKYLRCLVSAVAETYRLSRPCCSVFWVYNWRPFSGG